MGDDTRTRIDANIAMRCLHESCGRIHETFLAVEQPLSGGLSLQQAEKSVKDDFGIVYHHSQRIARTLLIAKTFGAFAEYNPNMHNELDDIAAEVASKLFTRRKSDLFEIVHVLRRLNEKNHDPAPSDMYFFLRSTIDRLIDRNRDEYINQANPAYHGLLDKIKYYCKRSSRYIIGKDTIALVAENGPDVEPRVRSMIEIEAACSGYIVRFRSMRALVSDAVDLVFELLEETGGPVPATSFGNLRTIVYRLIEPYVLPRYSPPPPISPWSDMLLGNSLRALDDTAACIDTEYNWRGAFSEEEKRAMTEAARDYLYEAIMVSDPSHSLFGCLADQILDLQRGEYDRRFKGCIQNLVLWMRDRIRGILGAE